MSRLLQKTEKKAVIKKQKDKLILIEMTSRPQTRPKGVSQFQVSKDTEHNCPCFKLMYNVAQRGCVTSC